MTRVKVSVTQNDLTCYLISGRVFRYYPVVMVVGVFQMVVRGFRQNWSIFSAPLPVFTDCNSFLSLMCLLCPVKVENIRLDKSFVVGGISRTFYFSLFLVFFPKVMVHFFIVFTFYTNKQLLSNYSLWCCLKLFIYLFVGIYGGDATEEKMGHPYCVSYRVYHRSMLQHASIDFIFI